MACILVSVAGLTEVRLRYKKRGMGFAAHPPIFFVSGWREPKRSELCRAGENLWEKIWKLSVSLGNSQTCVKRCITQPWLSLRLIFSSTAPIAHQKPHFFSAPRVDYFSFILTTLRNGLKSYRFRVGKIVGNFVGKKSEVEKWASTRRTSSRKRWGSTDSSKICIFEFRRLGRLSYSAI